MIKSMHHTGLVVRDLDAAVQFYRDVVGLSIETTRERKGPPDFPGGGLRRHPPEGGSSVDGGRP